MIFPRDSAPSPISPHGGANQYKAKPNMRQWQRKRERRLLAAFLKSCSSNYTRRNWNIVNPGQGPAFHERQGGNDRATAPTPPFSCLVAAMSSRLPWTERERCFPNARYCLCCNMYTERQFVLGLGVLIFNIPVVLVYTGFKTPSACKMVVMLSGR